MRPSVTRTAVSAFSDELHRVRCGTYTTGPETADLRFGIPGTYQVAQCRDCGAEQKAPASALPT